MKYNLQYWDKVSAVPKTVSEVFSEPGQLVSYLKPRLPVELSVNHWTLLYDEGAGYFTVRHSQSDREEEAELMNVNPAYTGIVAIRNAFLKELDK